MGSWSVAPAEPKQIVNYMEKDIKSFQSDTWSLGCDITIEDVNAEIQEIKVSDISLSGVVVSEEVSVDIDSETANIMDIDIHVAIDGVNSSIVASQVVPYERIIKIDNLSPEATNEKRYAASAYSVAKHASSIEETNRYITSEIGKQKEYTDRQFENAKETIEKLEEALLANFSEGISPITIKTMSMLLGDESSQFRFVSNKTKPSVTSPTVRYDKDEKRILSDGDIIQHMTIGITGVSNYHDASEYKFWDVRSYYATLQDPSKAYYLYIKASKTSQSAEFITSANAIALNEVDGYYHFLTAIINSEYNDDRSVAFLYGFTEILPGQITTDIIKSGNSKLIIDLANAIIEAKDGATIKGSVTIGSGSSGLDNLSEWNEKQQQINRAQQEAEAAKAYVDVVKKELLDQIDGAITNWFGEETPTLDNYPADKWTTEADKDAHLGDLYYSGEGKVYRFQKSASGEYEWRYIPDNDLAQALEMAQKAQDTADGKRRIFIEQPYAPYDKGDLWAGGENYPLKVCVFAKSEGQSFSDSDWAYADNTKQSVDNLATSVENVRQLANNAQSTANSASAKLAEWANDAIISPVEKQGLKDEIAFITADYNDISLNYQKYILEFDTLILQDGKQYVTEDGFVFNVQKANANWNGYRSAYNTYLNDLRQKVNASEAVAVGNLQLYQSNFYAARTAILEDISLSIKAEADYSKTAAETAISRVQDFSYLESAFGKGNNLNVAGVVMSQMVAVANSPNASQAKVKAFLNGSSYAGDGEHGKLILAGGIPEGNSDLKERAKVASTRIYEDGCTFTKNLHLENGCTIGDFSITENAILINGCNTQGAGHTVRSSKHGFQAIGTSSNGYSCIIERDIKISARDADDAIVDIQTKEENDDAILIRKGKVSGIRQRAQVLTTNGTAAQPHNISEYDRTTILNTPLATSYVVLTEEPQDCQEHKIIVCSSVGGIHVYTQGIPVYDIMTRKETTNIILNVNQKIELDLIYADYKWWVSYRYLSL